MKLFRIFIPNRKSILFLVWVSLSLLSWNGLAQQSHKINVIVNTVTEEFSKIKISYTLPPTFKGCYSIRKVILRDSASRNIVHAKSLDVQGPFKYDNNPTNTVSWDYVKDNIYLEGKYSILIEVEGCSSPNQPNITSRIPHPLSLKIVVGAVGITSAIFATLTKQDFDKKVSLLNELDATLPQTNNNFTNQADLDKWNTAYNNAKTAQKSELLSVAVGVSAVALVYEAYLLFSHKKDVSRKISFAPSAGQFGLALNIKF